MDMSGCLIYSLNKQLNTLSIDSGYLKKKKKEKAIHDRCLLFSCIQRQAKEIQLLPVTMYPILASVFGPFLSDVHSSSTPSRGPLAYLPGTSDWTNPTDLCIVSCYSLCLFFTGISCKEPPYPWDSFKKGSVFSLIPWFLHRN